MDEIVSHFLDDKHIDSVQKLFFLLYLYQHPDTQKTGPEFGRQLYLGFTPQLDKMILDLQAVRLIDQVDDEYTLHNEPQVRVCLQHLVEAFEDPLIRQQILHQVKQRLPRPDNLLPH